MKIAISYYRMKSNTLTKASPANQIKSTSTFTPKGTVGVMTDLGTRTAGALIHIYECKSNREMGLVVAIVCNTDKCDKCDKCAVC